MGKWKDYINKNRTAGDCQLITSVNAYHYLTGKKVDDKTYEYFIELCRCRHGRAIKIEEVWDELGLKILGEYKSLYEFDHDDIKDENGLISSKTKKIPLPMEFSVWHKNCGFHSTLIVDHEVITNCVKITNFRWETNSEGWIFKEDLYKFERPTPTKDGWTYRLFGLK